MHKVPIQVDDLPNNMSYNYTYTLAYVQFDGVDADTILKTIYKFLVVRPMSNAINTDYLALNLQCVQKNVNAGKWISRVLQIFM